MEKCPNSKPDTLDLAAMQIERLPELSLAINPGHPTCMNIFDERMLILQDIEKLMSGGSSEQMDAVKTIH